MVMKIWLLVCLGVLLKYGLASGSQWQEKAETERKMVWYTTIGSADAKMLIDQFRQRYPKIDAEYFRSGGPQLVERIFTEARAGKHIWDVFMNSAIYTHLLNEKGMLAVYESPEARFYRDGYKDRRGTWTSIYTNYAVAGYNTKLVPKEEVPKTYADLLKRFWFGQIGLDAKAYEWFAVVIRGMGEEKGLSLMRQLAKNKAQLRNGRELVAAVRAPIDTVEYHPHDRRRTGTAQSGLCQYPPCSAFFQSASSPCWKTFYRFCTVENRPGNNPGPKTHSGSDRYAPGSRPSHRRN